MTKRIGINGFGRIGRLVIRGLQHHPELQPVIINDPASTPETSAHLLQFDTVHGRYDGRVTVERDYLTIDGQTVAHTAHDTPGAVPWAEHGVDIVLECSGRFRTAEKLQPYLDGGVPKVIVAAPVKSDGVLNVVVGCNDQLYLSLIHI